MCQARFYAPSTVFFDEVEGLCSSREGSGDTNVMHRLKNVILQETAGESYTYVTVLYSCGTFSDDVAQIVSVIVSESGIYLT